MFRISFNSNLVYALGNSLPAEAFATAQTIKKYHTMQHDLHQGKIFPIGEEPSGKSWTGFESIQENHGYILVFREDNSQSSFTFKTRFKPNKKLILEPVIGNGKAFKTKTDDEGKILFSIKKTNT